MTKSFVAARMLIVGTLALIGSGLCAQPTLALSLNPLDYYDYDYSIVFSRTQVEPGQPFSITASATVRCTHDLPIGVRGASARFSVIARPTASGPELILADSYTFTVSDVPDWAGEEYSTTESIDLEFPEDTAPGVYVISARLEDLSLDGLNVTSAVPSSSRTVAVGTVTCTIPDEPPTPPPPPLPGKLTISVLGHEFRPMITTDGILTQAANAVLIEGVLSLQIKDGTECLGSSGDPLEYISVAQALSPRPYADGVVLSAFNLFPNGARFSPGLELGIVYEPAALPAGCSEDDLKIGYYDNDNETWTTLPTTVDKEHHIVSITTSHFTTFGILAPTTTFGPARFVVRSLVVTPAVIPPFGRVTATIGIANTGDTDDRYPLVVAVNGQQEHAQAVELGPRESTLVSVTIVRSEAGVYTVSVGDMSGTFQVVAPQTGSTPNVTPAQGPTAGASDGTSQTPSSASTDGGMNPIYIILLVLASIAFLALVILVLAGVL